MSQIYDDSRTRNRQSAPRNRAPQRNTEFPLHEVALRDALQWVQARYDYGAVNPAVFNVIRMIETEIAWRRQQRGARQS
jgi:hypothetical protein